MIMSSCIHMRQVTPKMTWTDGRIDLSQLVKEKAALRRGEGAELHAIEQDPNPSSIPTHKWKEWRGEMINSLKPHTPDPGDLHWEDEPVMCSFEKQQGLTLGRARGPGKAESLLWRSSIQCQWV